MVWLYLTLLSPIWFNKTGYGNWSCSGFTSLDVRRELSPYKMPELKHDRPMTRWTVSSKLLCRLFYDDLSDTPGINFLSFSLIPG